MGSILQIKKFFSTKKQELCGKNFNLLKELHDLTKNS